MTLRAAHLRCLLAIRSPAAHSFQIVHRSSYMTNAFPNAFVVVWGKERR